MTDLDNKEEPTPDVVVAILDDEPEVMKRPLAIVEGNTYINTWVSVQRTIRREVIEGEEVIHDPPKVVAKRVPVVVRDDGSLFCDYSLGIIDREGIGKAGIEIALRDVASATRYLSGRGLKAIARNKQVDIVELHRDISTVIDRFVDFQDGFADQSTMSDLIACYIISTVFIDALPVVGYLWINGEPGSGKTQLLLMVSMLSHLATLVANSGSLAALRDIASAGGTLCIDDAEKITGDGVDPEKQSLLLAGNRPDVTVPIKEPTGDKNQPWKTTHYHVYCARCFSATTLPIDTLRTRSIIIPIVASDDATKTNASPEDDSTWPNGITQRSVIDRLWTVGLQHMAEVQEHDRSAIAQAKIQGRGYQPWRGLMATAHLIDSKGHTGLFDRMQAALAGYLSDPSTPTRKDRGTMVLLGLAHLVTKSTEEEPTFPTSDIRDAAIDVAVEHDVFETAKGDNVYSAKQIGQTMRKLRFQQPEIRNKYVREWVVSRTVVRRKIRAANLTHLTAWKEADTLSAITSQTSQTSLTSPNGQKSTNLGPNSDIGDISDIAKEGVSPTASDIGDVGDNGDIAPGGISEEGFE